MYRIVSWPFYRDMYRIVGKCIVAALPISTANVRAPTIVVLLAARDVQSSVVLNCS